MARSGLSWSSVLWVVVLLVALGAGYFVLQMDTTGRKGTTLDRYDLSPLQEVGAGEMLAHEEELVVELDLAAPAGRARRRAGGPACPASTIPRDRRSPGNPRPGRSPGGPRTATARG